MCCWMKSSRPEAEDRPKVVLELMRGGWVSLQTRGLVNSSSWTVSDTDIQALFGKLGDLQSAVLHHKKQGKSLHTAHGAFIIFN